MANRFSYFEDYFLEKLFKSGNLGSPNKIRLVKLRPNSCSRKPNMPNTSFVRILQKAIVIYV